MLENVYVCLGMFTQLKRSFPDLRVHKTHQPLIGEYEDNSLTLQCCDLFIYTCVFVVLFHFIHRIDHSIQYYVYQNTIEISITTCVLRSRNFKMM